MNRKTFILFFTLLTLLPLRAQTYLGHTAVTGGNNFTAGAMTTDAAGNLFTGGAAEGSLLLQKEVDTDLKGTVRMMSYNIKGSDIFSSRILKRITNVINDYTPDVVAVQEVSNYLFDAAATLGTQTGMYSQFLVTEKSYFGCVLLSKEKPLSVTNHLVERGEASTDPADYRGVIIAEFPDYYFMSTHFSLYGEDQVRMIEFMIDFARNAGKTVFLGGDLNLSATSPNMKLFLNNGFQLISDPSILTFPATKPTSCIDFFLSYNDAMTVMYEVTARGIADQTTSDLTTASDHLPVYADLNLYKGTETGHLVELERGNKGIYLIKQTPGNETEWIRCLQGTGEITLNELHSDAEGNLYAAGTCRDFMPATGSGVDFAGTGSFFLSFKNNGNYRWTRFVPAALSGTRYASLTPAPDGTLLAGFDADASFVWDGTAVSVAAPGSLIASVSEAGALRWYRTIEPAAGSDSRLNRMVSAPDGTAYAVFTANGATLSVAGASATAGAHTAYSCYVARLGADGTPLWVRRLQGVGSRSETQQRDLCFGNGAAPVAATADASGNLSILLWGSGKRVEAYDADGVQLRTFAGFSTSTSLDYGGMGVIRLTPAGDPDNLVSLGDYESMRRDDGTFRMNGALVSDLRGNLYVGGYSTSAAFAYQPGYAPASRGKADFFLGRIDAAGVLSFIRRVGGEGDDELPVLALDPASDRLIAGMRTNSAPAYLGLNEAADAGSQEQCIRIPQNYRYLFLTHYRFDGMTAIDAAGADRIRITAQAGAIRIEGLGAAARLVIHDLSGRIIASHRIDTPDALIPHDGSAFPLVVVSLTTATDRIIRKLSCNPY